MFRLPSFILIVLGLTTVSMTADKDQLLPADEPLFPHDIEVVMGSMRFGAASLGKYTQPNDLECAGIEDLYVVGLRMPKSGFREIVFAAPFDVSKPLSDIVRSRLVAIRDRHIGISGLPEKVATVFLARLGEGDSLHEVGEILREFRVYRTRGADAVFQGVAEGRHLLVVTTPNNVIASKVLDTKQHKGFVIEWRDLLPSRIQNGEIRRLISRHKVDKNSLK